MDIIKVIGNTLDSISKRGITVVQGWYDKNINKTHITFCLLSDREDNYTDDEAEEVMHLIQVDIWSKKDEWQLKREVKKLLSSNNFGYVEGEDFFEIDTKLFHKALRFRYIEEVI